MNAGTSRSGVHWHWHGKHACMHGGTNFASHDMIPPSSSLLMKLADKIAASGYYVVVRGFFYGEPYDPQNTNRPLGEWLKDHGTDVWCGPGIGFASDHASASVDCVVARKNASVDSIGYSKVDILCSESEKQRIILMDQESQEATWNQSRPKSGKTNRNYYPTWFYIRTPLLIIVFSYSFIVEHCANPPSSLAMALPSRPRLSSVLSLRTPLLSLLPPTPLLPVLLPTLCCLCFCSR
ncbi:hypothetical protein Ahy_B01g056968 isoform K [Arachis hypogaea]|uniref:Uncharacterized protein n=1 Tax=Arachis hypogaea TaxID=3818 RepID=A0A445B030_ARAHY|nr:hypothetical protein Ahy_B01g056968 isoform K [Arachis hypogaea]